MYDSTEKVYTDIPHLPWRRLQKKFSSHAIGTTNPNNLHSNAPVVSDAMGLTPSSGILHFTHDGASQPITPFIWNGNINQCDPTNGWTTVGASSAAETATVDPHTVASFKLPPDAPYVLMAGTSAINNVWVADKQFLPGIADNTDKTVVYP